MYEAHVTRTYTCTNSSAFTDLLHFRQFSTFLKYKIKVFFHLTQAHCVVPIYVSTAFAPRQRIQCKCIVWWACLPVLPSIHRYLISQMDGQAELTQAASYVPANSYHPTTNTELQQLALNFVTTFTRHHPS